MNFPPGLPAEFPARAAAAGLHAEDVSENFILGSGHGGQNRNKRSTAVQLVHHTFEIEVRCFRKREQHQNRIEAWRILLEKVEERKRDIEQAFAREEFVGRAQKRKRSRGSKEEMLREKKQRGQIKEMRQKKK